MPITQELKQVSHELEASRAYWLAEINRLLNIMKDAHAKLHQARTAGTDSRRLIAEAEQILFEELYEAKMEEPA